MLVFLWSGFSSLHAEHRLKVSHALSLLVNEKGQIVGLEKGERTIMAPKPKGFFVQAPDQRDGRVPLLGSFTPAVDGGVFRLRSEDGLSCVVEAKSKRGVLAFEGNLSKKGEVDAARWLIFELPSLSSDWRIEDSMDNRAPYSEAIYKKKAFGHLDAKGNNIFPLISGSASDGGLGLAVPPTSPCIFVTDGDRDKLGMRLALGLTHHTSKFPNQAPFALEVYDVAADWGFRALLEAYYNQHPEYYETTPRKIKLFNHHHDWIRGGRIEDLSHKLIDPKKEEHTFYFKTSCRIKDIKTKGLKQGISDFEKTVSAHQSFHIQVDSKNPEDPRIPTAQQRIINSVNHNADGTVPLWLKKNEIDVPHNADPDLFEGRDKPTMGKWYMDYVKSSLDMGRFVIMHWDRFGGWGNSINYRKDHMAYQDYAATFDSEGRVCSPTKFSFWKLMKRLREWGSVNGTYFQETAGLKVFGATKFSRIAGMGKDGRFFTGAMVDAGWREGSTKPVELGEMDSMRVFLGRKCYRMSTGNIVEHKHLPTLERIKLALAKTSFYGFACPVQIEYFYSPEHRGFLKDYSRFHEPEHQKLWNGYRPAVEAIRLAGWEPVTHARVTTGQGVGVERFGELGRDKIYLTVWGAEPSAKVKVKVDYKAMGFSACPQIKELVSGVKIDVSKDGGTMELQVPMTKNMTRILELGAVQHER